jgi:hypothetical protein
MNLLLMHHRFYIFTNCWFWSLFTLSDSFFLIYLTSSNREKSIYLFYLALFQALRWWLWRSEARSIEIPISEVSWDRITEHTATHHHCIFACHISPSTAHGRGQSKPSEISFSFPFLSLCEMCIHTPPLLLVHERAMQDTLVFLDGRSFCHASCICDTTASSFCGPGHF